MTNWREALQQQLYPVLTRLLQEGFVLPLYVTCIGHNGSMMCGRYDDIDATGLDCIFDRLSEKSGQVGCDACALPCGVQQAPAGPWRAEGRVSHECLWTGHRNFSDSL